MSETPAPLERKLTAILYADVAGYSRLTEADEGGTHRLLSDCLDHFTGCIERHSGRVEHYAGDAILAEFPSVTLAVRCALTVQAELAAKQSEIPEDRRVRFRIGINLGEVIVDRGEIYGEGVNIAARLETLAEPGGICISDAVRVQVRDLLPLEYRDLGAQKVKNIADPIRAFHVALRDDAELPPVEIPAPRRAIPWLTVAMSVVIVALVGVVVLVWMGVIAPRQTVQLQLPDKPSLAVLPFTNLNADPSQAYFVDGITDDLITDLSKVPALFVISSNSSSRYRGQEIDIRQIALELGVRYILTGTLRRTPKTLRLNAQLTEARSGETVWADRYDANLEQIFDLQDVIVANVVATVSGGSSPADVLAGKASRVVDIDAYDLFLQGWAHFNRETPAGYSDAMPLLAGAVEQDPTFFRPHAVLAAIYYQGGLRRWHQQWGISSYEASRRAYAHLQSAMAEPTSLAYSVDALMHVYNGRHDQAIEQARKAVELDPNDPTAHIMLARALSMSGKGVLALEHTRLAMRLNPHHPSSYEWTGGLAHFVNEEYTQAKELFEQAGTEQAGLDLVPLLATYGILGKTREADELLALQKVRWQQWRPGYPMTVRSLIADFPPFLDPADGERLRAGLAAVLDGG